MYHENKNCIRICISLEIIKERIKNMSCSLCIYIVLINLTISNNFLYLLTNFCFINFMELNLEINAGDIIFHMFNCIINLLRNPLRNKVYIVE